MAVYLVQHGLSLSEEQDPERGLSDTGKTETKRIGDVAKHYQITVSAIRHSGKKRARETAVIFNDILTPPDGISSQAGLNPMDDVTGFAKTIDPTQNVMYVGHLPFMERLVSYLVAGREAPPVFAFQNSGIVCLDKAPDTGAWVIRWTLMPHIG
ncbi:phosphohistidine phosphatase SixA [Desulfatiferula olefinivorans]